MKLLFLTILTPIVTFLQSFNLPTSTNMILHFDGDDYSASWKKIDSLDQKGLYKSALPLVTELLTKAKIEKNAPQQVKALTYKAKYNNLLEDNNYAKVMTDWEKELKTTDFPVKEVMQSMLAEMYQHYLENNYWSAVNGTSLNDSEPTLPLTLPLSDKTTCTLHELNDYIFNLYQTSIQNDELKKVSIQDFGAFTTTQKNNADAQQPTLYDYLAHRAVSYYINEKNYLTEPSFKFEIQDPNLFLVPFSVTSKEINSKSALKTPQDSTSNKYRALKLLTDLVLYHKNDENPTAIIDVELKRLDFLYKNCILLEKKELYYTALTNLATAYQNDEASTEVTAKIAAIFIESAQTYNPLNDALIPTDKTHKFDFKTALTFIEEAIKKYPTSYGADKCKLLRNDIFQKHIAVQTELVYPINEAWLCKLNYRNVNTVFYAVKKYSKEIEASIIKTLSKNYTTEQLLKAIAALPTEQTGRLNLPDDKDYQTHSIEFGIKGLPSGEYKLLVSDVETMNAPQMAIGYDKVVVSDLTYTLLDTKENTTLVFVVNRVTGEPQKDAKITIFTDFYNTTTQQYDAKVVKTLTTDAAGKANVAVKNETYKLTIKKGTDELTSDQHYGSYRENNTTEEQKTGYFFLDRAIYRPGQTVYFKVLAIKFNGKQMPTILKNEKITMEFTNANGEKVSELKVTTNEFGTCNGNFTTPTSGLLGTMSLQIVKENMNGSTFFQVEEYKRPRFEVTIDTLKGAYRLNDTIRIAATAKNFAGNVVNDAAFTYRVERTARYPFMDYYWAKYYTTSAPQEITHGKGVSDNEGKCKINFTAIPDKAVDATTKPIFDYTVFVEVTDMTGEVHSTQQIVSAGYTTLIAELTVAETIDKQTPTKLKIKTTNTNAVFEAATVTLSMIELIAPKQVFKPRYWERPDKQVLTQKEFNTVFPLIAFQTENEPLNFKTGKEIFTTKLTTKELTEVEIPTLKKLKTGHYKLILATADKFGTKVEVVKYIVVTDFTEKELTSTNLFFSKDDERELTPNKDVATTYYGAMMPGKMLYCFYEANKIINVKWLSLQGLNKVFTEVKEAHRGNKIGYTAVLFSQNRIKQISNQFNVPWNNKKLAISYETFRDKLTPGADEEWRIRIKDAKGDNVFAEMLATMYDASLDQFAANSYELNLFPTQFETFNFEMDNQYNSSTSSLFETQNWQNRYISTQNRIYRTHKWFGFPFYDKQSYAMLGDRDKDAVVYSMSAAPPPTTASGKSEMKMVVTQKVMEANDKSVATTERADKETPKETPPPSVAVRTNLKETVFFFPDLKTDANGDILLKFKMNEALTRWKFLGLAHTQNLEVATTEKMVVTQKELMVIPNPPRFLREGDELEFVAKVANLSDKTLSGTAKLEIEDALTGQSVLSTLLKGKNEVAFIATATQSTAVAWKLTVPLTFTTPVVWRVIATADKFADGEENALPVLTNKQLVVETMALPIRGNQEKTFLFKSADVLAAEKEGKKGVELPQPLTNGISNKTFTFEFTSNPAWYAIQSLPYLMEYPYDCTEQIFSKYYANSLATNLVNSYPKIKKVFDSWKGTAAMKSNLSKNEELKTALLSETPWVMAAQNEETQRNNIALLFDLNKMADEQAAALKKLQDRQLANGGFAWFTGGRDDWFITQNLVAEFGHLTKLLGTDKTTDSPQRAMIVKAVQYCDKELVKNYELLLKRVANKQAKLEDDNLGAMEAHYLYARSFYLDIPLDAKTQKIVDYYLAQAENYWLKGSEYEQGLLALALHRFKPTQLTAKLIVKSLNERSLNSEEMGMYWKYPTGYYWYQSPIENHALLIEVFDEVAKDATAVDNLKTWLLKNRQTNAWKTTKATTAACYALLRTGDNWLLEDKNPTIAVGKQQIVFNSSSLSTPTTKNVTTEAGSGYFKTSWKDAEVTSDIATIKIKNNNKGVAWGGAYWQYLEVFDKIKTFQATPLTLKKTILRSENGDFGAKTSEVKATDVLKVGDKVVMRLEIAVERNMEFVHLKDGRPSGFEPVATISSYKWEGGLGFYQETRDAATNFFFDRLPKGNYVLEYSLTVQQRGVFAAGIATAQCMYAPEFTAHTEGVTVTVK